MDDDDFDDKFLAKFKRGPNDPKPSWALSSENLLEEMEEVPLFMTKLPENIEENPMLSALQALVYDGTPEEIATNFKNQGNEAYKEKRFDDACMYYTKGLEQNEITTELKTTLHLNRAAVHLEKKNYGFALKDCKQCLEMNPKSVKAYFRAAKAFFALDKLKSGLQCCDKALEIDPGNEDLLKQKELIIKRIEYYLKLAKESQKKNQEKELIKKIIQDRKLKWIDQPNPVMLPCPRDQLPHVRIAELTINDQNPILIWPVLFLYPFYDLSDFINSFNENDTFEAHINAMLDPTPAWDTYQKFKDKNSLKIFYKDLKGKPKQVALREKLVNVLTSDFVVKDGIPVFYIVRLVNGSLSNPRVCTILMFYLGQKESAELDLQLMSIPYNFKLEQLMELAGYAVSQAIHSAVSSVANEETQSKRKFLVICGPGNNGGDGIVCARHLQSYGHECVVHCIKTKHDFLLDQCRSSGIQVIDKEIDCQFLESFDFIIDAIFGFGYKTGSSSGNGYIKILDLIAASSTFVIPIDVPSGWSIDESNFSGESNSEKSKINPQIAVSLTWPKPCMKQFTGRHYLANRFVPRELLQKFNIPLIAYSDTEQFVLFSHQ